MFYSMPEILKARYFKFEVGRWYNFKGKIDFYEAEYLIDN